MAASDATPFPIKNTAYRVTFPILDNDGDLVAGAAGLDSEVSLDAGTFADCTNEATEIATSSGVYYLDLTAAEMNADTVAVKVKSTTTDSKDTVLVMYPQEAGDIKVDVESISGGTAAADNLELDYNGTGYAKANSTIGTCTTNTDMLTAAAVNAEVDTALTDIGLDHLVSASVAGADVTDNSIVAKLVSSSATADWDDYVNTTDSLQAARDNIGTNGASLTDLGGMSTAMKAEVNAEALDVIATDTYAEPGQEAPGATVSLSTKINYLYKAWRNKSTQTSTTYSLFADDTTTVDQKATVSDDGTTTTKGEVATGP